MTTTTIEKVNKIFESLKASNLKELEITDAMPLIAAMIQAEALSEIRDALENIADRINRR